MKAIQEYINKKQTEFAQHPFFKHIRKRLPLQQTMGFAPFITFWVMTFQDALRLNAILTKDPKLREFAHHHKEEDTGHEKWFLSDLAILFNVDNLSIEWLYGPSTAKMRDSTNMVLAELIKAESDPLRTVVLLTMESTSQLFSKEITSYIIDMGYGEKLKYFSKTHFDAENDHAMYEETGEEQLHAIKFSPQEKEKAKALVDYIYAISHSLADTFLKEIEKGGSLKFHPHILDESTSIEKVKVA